MTEKAALLEAARERLGYLLSLPERTLRSLAALVSGAVVTLTEIVLPDSFRDSTIYRITLGLSLQFLVERVAQVQRQAEGVAGSAPVSPNFAQRKLAGTVLEAAGLLAIHFSPLWVFAIAADAAAGSKVFLERLSEHLKQNGLVRESTPIRDLVDVLATMQEATGKSATAIDMPPLSRKELLGLAAELKASYAEMFLGMANLLPDLEALWLRMKDVAWRENVPVEELGGALTLDLAARAQKGIGATRALGRAGAELVGEQILASYERTLNGIAKEGAEKYFSRKMSPFLKAAAGQFGRGKTTWIQSRLVGEKRNR